MNNKDKIIVALDTENLADAVALAKSLSPHVGAIKVGLEVLTSVGAPQVVNELKSVGANIFFDGKFKDIPNTIAGAVRGATKMGVWMLNVHCMGGRKMMETAAATADETARAAGVKKPLVIGVTVLTSMDVAALREIGMNVTTDDQLKEVVVNLAKLAKASGLDGVVASPKEITAIRAACGKDFLIVTPGVRPEWASVGDQKRVMTPKEAVTAGADFLVIGRPITKPPAEIGTPVDAAKKIVEEI